MPDRRPRLGVFKFASCDGCQLTMLDLEESLLEIADAVDIAYFREATSNESQGPFDLTLIDGSITTARDRDRIREIRQRSRFLVALGACATTGGIQALRNFRDVDEMCRIVYARPEYIDTLATSTAIADHVPVDFELRGCPPNRHQLLELVSAFLNRRTPAISAAQRLPRVQAARERLRDGDGNTLPGSGHARRLRRDLPRLRPWLLWLLRPHGGAQHRVAGAGVRGRRKDAPGSPARVPHLQRQRARVPRGR